MNIKTLKTPDKIFLPGDIDWASAAFLTLGNQPGDVEYIRKDAMLEYLRKEYSIVDGYLKAQDDQVFYGQLNVLQQVIDKIESL